MNFLACGPGLMCGYLSNLFFSTLLAMCPGRVLAAETRDGLQEKGATMETSKYVTEPLRLKTRSIRACPVCPLTTRVRAGTSCSMNTFTPLCDCMTSARHHPTAACLRSTPPPYRHPWQSCCCVSTGLLQIRPAALSLGKTVQRLWRWEPPGAGASISWLPKRGSSDPQPRTLHCWAA